MTPYVELSSDGLATIHAPGATDGVTPGIYVAAAAGNDGPTAGSVKQARNSCRAKTVIALLDVFQLRERQVVDDR